MHTPEQLEALYRISYQLTFSMLQPIHLICVDERTSNIYVFAGYEKEIEFLDRFTSTMTFR